MYIITSCIVSFPYTVLQFTVPRLALISQSEAVYCRCPDILRYQITDLIWLRCYAHLAEFGFGK